MDIREIPFLLFDAFAVSRVTPSGRYVREGLNLEGYTLRVEQCEHSSHLTLWNYHADPESDAPLFSVNAGPTMAGSCRFDRGEQYRECIWSTLHPQIGNQLWLPFTPVIGRIMILANDLWMRNCFETTVTWSLETTREDPQAP